jgi:DNA-binding transcriptional LysR family regulator
MPAEHHRRSRVTLPRLRVLIAVADRGGFTPAAESLGISQPAVSRAISALEAELGATLLTRNRDGATLTEAGQLAARHGREALRQLELMRTRIADAVGQLAGQLRLASLPSATGVLVSSLLRGFAERYPRVRVRLLEGSDQEVRGWLADGAADVGVVTLPAPGLRAVPLDTHQMLVALPAGHPLADRASIGFDQLAEQPFVLSTGGCGTVITAAARAAGVRLRVAFEAREMSAVLEMVSSGLGVSVLPALGLPAGFDAVLTRPLHPPLTRSLAVALGAKAAASPTALAFLAHAADRKSV